MCIKHDEKWMWLPHSNYECCDGECGIKCRINEPFIRKCFLSFLHDVILSQRDALATTLGDMPPSKMRPRTLTPFMIKSSLIPCLIMNPVECCMPSGSLESQP